MQTFENKFALSSIKCILSKSSLYLLYCSLFISSILLVQYPQDCVNQY